MRIMRFYLRRARKERPMIRRSKSPSRPLQTMQGLCGLRDSYFLAADCLGFSDGDARQSQCGPLVPGPAACCASDPVAASEPCVVLYELRILVPMAPGCSRPLV